jgi:glycosyltransferase involved in cell wall biosynthesis
MSDTLAPVRAARLIIDGAAVDAASGRTFTTTNPATVALLCRLLGGPPYSFTVHGPEEFDKPESLGMAEKIRGAAFVVAVSSFGRSQLWRWARHEDWEKVKVVRCGLGADLIGAAPTPVTAAPRLLCIARLSEQKGHLLLVEAAARLAAEGRRFELVLAGDGPLRATIERLVRLHGLDAHVRITGWVSGERVREELVASRALVQPSFAEGLPVVLMEALALARPVVTTYVAGIPELVEPGVSGWLVPAGDVDALAAAMREALDATPARLDAMGRAGRERVVERHDAAREAALLATHFAGAAER